VSLAETWQAIPPWSIPFLHDFTDQDLEKIGVRSLGQRRKLLWRIADLGA
jgi:hypothetical protein